MNPWQTVWAPNVNFPWSGSVAQRVEPTANWFFDSIDANAGDARIERKAFEKASYGRQIGWLTEIVIALASESKTMDRGENSPLHKLETVKAEIDKIKLQEASSAASDIEDKLQWLKKNDAAEYTLLAKKLISILQENE
ncbi:MAG: hypothetical protein QE278_13330 [Limnobacter sp.]|nr:hypothetical protein [Limnobacter sp.]